MYPAIASGEALPSGTMLQICGALNGGTLAGVRVD
jgi:hypothetical protein